MSRNKRSARERTLARRRSPPNPTQPGRLRVARSCPKARALSVTRVVSQTHGSPENGPGLAWGAAFVDGRDRSWNRSWIVKSRMRALGPQERSTPRQGDERMNASSHPEMLDTRIPDLRRAFDRAASKVGLPLPILPQAEDLFRRFADHTSPFAPYRGAPGAPSSGAGHGPWPPWLCSWRSVRRLPLRRRSRWTAAIAPSSRPSRPPIATTRWAIARPGAVRIPLSCRRAARTR